MIQVEALFSGKVQGVGFRATARILAHHLNLSGFVKNLSNGHVELVAQGPKNKLEVLISQLKEHFPGMKIEKLSYVNSAKDFEEGFSIEV